jgi:hypothetical protein
LIGLLSNKVLLSGNSVWASADRRYKADAEIMQVFQGPAELLCLILMHLVKAKEIHSSEIGRGEDERRGNTKAMRLYDREYNSRETGNTVVIVGMERNR